MSVPVVIYTTPWCPFCVRAKQLLGNKGVQYTDIDVAAEPARRQEMIEKSGRTTVPQIWIDDRHVGGCDELYALERQGRLNELLKL
jgi:glutaredoxin 3